MRTTPTVVAIATPPTNASDTGTAFSAVTKIIAEMIWGPAIIVMASGKISRFIPPHSAAIVVRRLGFLLRENLECQARC